MFHLDRLSTHQVERRLLNAIRQRLEDQDILVYFLDIKTLENKDSLEPRLVYTFSRVDWDTKIKAMNEGLLYDDTHEAFGLTIHDEQDINVLANVFADKMRIEQKYDWRV